MEPFQNTTIIFPFYGSNNSSGGLNQLRKSVAIAQRYSKKIYIVEDGSNIIKKEDFQKGPIIIKLPENRGKIAASRVGIQEALKDSSVQFFVVSDWDEEQDQKDIALIIETLQQGKTDVVIGNRYELFAFREIPKHRITVNQLQLFIARQFGFEATDFVSGLIGCNRAFGKLFIENSRCTREGVGLEWLILAYLFNRKLVNVPIHAKMRSEQTSGDKLVRNSKILLSYKNELLQKGKKNLVDTIERLVSSLERKEKIIFISLDAIGSSGALKAEKEGAYYSLKLVK